MKKWILPILFLLVTGSVKAEEMPTVSAKSAILIEYTTGKVLYAKNAEERLPMASTTKIMTALLALETANLSDVVTIGPNAAGVEGSSMYLKAGETMTMEDLLYGLMLSSGNDAAVAIAEHIAGSEEAFAERMTARAKELGCVNTQFKNANGLPDEKHYTTALELACITGKAMENETFRKIVASTSARAGGRYLSNHNKMLSIYEGAIGVKTGYTKAAGRTLVSAAKRDDITLIAVTLNAPDDWDDHSKMLDYGFERMEKRQIVFSGKNAGEIKVDGGTKESVSALFASDFFLPVLKTEKVEIKCLLPESIPAPIKAGQEIGSAEVFLEGVKMGEVELLSMEDVEKAEEPSLCLWEILCIVFGKWASIYLL